MDQKQAGVLPAKLTATSATATTNMGQRSFDSVRDRAAMVTTDMPPPTIANSRQHGQAALGTELAIDIQQATKAVATNMLRKENRTGLVSIAAASPVRRMALRRRRRHGTRARPIARAIPAT